MTKTSNPGSGLTLFQNINRLSLKGVDRIEEYDFNFSSYTYLNSFTKRALDILGACIGIIISLPICFLATLTIAIIDRVPIIFSQKRVGLQGVEFTFYKLRTLKVIETRETVDIKRINIKPDYKTTYTGKFWRVTSIDEMLQFWLVLKGEMSLIGHRPFPNYYLPHLGKIQGMDEDKLRHYLSIISQYKPGMSSLSSVNGRGNLTMKQKFEYDLIYAGNASFWYDIQLLFHTLVVVITQEGAK